MEISNKLSYIYGFISPILDILILAVLIYKAYDFMSKTNSIQILKGFIYSLITRNILFSPVVTLIV